MAYKKPKKIRRKKRLFGKDRSRIFKGIGVALLGIALVCAGFFTARFMINNISADKSAPESSSPPGSTTAAPAATTASPPENPEDGRLRAFYLPVRLLADTAALDAAVSGASEAGFNAVLFDLKDEDGTIYYATSHTVGASCMAAGALTTDQMKAAVSHLKSKNLTPIARIYAFKDKTAAVDGGRIMLDTNASTLWWDGANGKPWLNPYAQPAHDYITSLASELARNGLPVIMVDGVQFPDRTARANYGNSELRSLTQLQVLQKFMQELDTAVDARIIHTMPGLASFAADSEATKPFGGNPVTFGAQTVSPVLMPSTLGGRLTVGEAAVDNPAGQPYEAVKLAAGQIKSRIGLLDKDKQPQMMPWIEAGTYPAAQIKDQIRALTETDGADAAYVLYKADGRYDFAALK